MKIKYLFLIIIFQQLVFAQRDINTLLDNTLTHRGLTRQDIIIPIDFFGAAEKSPTNDAKLLMPLVRDMMINPLRSMTWIDSISTLSDEVDKWDLYSKLLFMSFNIPLMRNFTTTDRYIITIGETAMERLIFNNNPVDHRPDPLDVFLNNTRQKCKELKEFRNSLLKIYSKDEIDFLNRHLLSIFEESGDDVPSAFDIFKYNEARDSLIWVSKNVMDLLSKMNMSELVAYIGKGLTEYEVLKDESQWLLGKIDDLSYFRNKYVHGDFIYYGYENGVRIAIGGPGKNIYTGMFDVIIDVGGDDVYDIENENNSLDKRNKNGFSCIIDLSGNDRYAAKSNFSLAGGLFSSSFIYDKEGDDVYEGKTGCLGAAIGGLGMIYDERGNDTYRAETFSIGAGCFGLGLLMDNEGNDFYIANSYAEGFGFTKGVGCIIDNKGNDDYLIDSRSLDIGRYNDHYISMCQGYGLGLRPYYAGGIGLIIEGEGNDIYHTDIFGQGGAYWYSLGAIVDKSGHDKYDSYQYAQGAGIHLAVGLLKDYDGWDFYTSDGVSQGCGHDFGFGMLWDVKGNDNYSAYSLSQGAGNANGIGMLFDESGVDGYLVKDFNNTRGYGNPRREFGSIGVFIDGSGDDAYAIKQDSVMLNTSTWGVRSDYPEADLPEHVSGDNFKVNLDTIKRSGGNISGTFTTEEYFIMAKTIEPRFSLWQEYGFKKLIEDSVNTANHVITKLATDDARETQVLRVLARRIPQSLNNSLINKLNDYINNRSGLTQPEISLACYILGETGSSQGRDVMYSLTFDYNVRIRASAINALGKIPLDSNDTEFIGKVSSRLRDLVFEDRPEKLYNKDIAFAFRKYKDENNIPALEKLSQNIFFGARFLALEALKEYGR